MKDVTFTIRVLVLVCLVGSASLYAQEAQIKLKALDQNGMPKAIVFTKAQSESPQRLLQAQLKIDTKDDFKLVKTSTDELGLSHQSFQQFYKDVKVEYGQYKAHFDRVGRVTSMNGEFYDIPEIDVRPSLSNAVALQRAIDYVGANKYMWEDVGQAEVLEYDKPQGKLVIVENKLAYKFDVFAIEPLSRDYIYVDAKNGDVIHTNSIIHHAHAIGTAATRYSGSKTIATDSFISGFRLRDYTRGQGVETYDLNRSTSYSNAIDFVDNDNNWTAGEWNNSNKDNAALDAHWGAIQTYDYWITEHNRNSWDGNGARIRSYVHYSSNYDNAFWNGSVMTYGDGNNFDALTSLDVAAHEIGHAITTSTANLVYRYESGAMNEGFSDIWAACVESFAAPQKQIWQIGEDIDLANGTGLRSMSDPKSKGDPDTYKGTNWEFGSSDNGGVHTNSGVMNHWFYILTVGKTGSNDNGDSYSVTGIGITKAAKIAYRLESVYLSANSQFIDARNFGIQAAEDLYGAGSAEAIATQDAWYAVGLGSAFGGGGGGSFSCATTVSSFPYSEGFESSLGDWTQASGDDFNWSRQSGGTPSNNTGPTSAAGGSYYVYAEASSPNYPSKTTILESPCFDLSGESSATFSFNYHMYGAASMGGFELQASTEASGWTSLWSRSGNQGNSWLSANIDLSSYLGSVVKLRFIATTNDTWQGDVAVDNVDLTTGGTGGGGGSTTTLLESYFETGWDGWTDGGSDAFRYTGSFSWEGSYSIRLRDNSGVASSMTSGAYNLTSFDQVDITFYFYPNSMETGEDFWVRYFDGSSWNTVATYAGGSNFSNGNFYTATVTINRSNYNFPSNAQFRFQCDASANADQVYIDEVTIVASSNTSLIAGSSGSTEPRWVGSLNQGITGINNDLEGISEDIILYPNPTRDYLNISAQEEDIQSIKIYTLSGVTVDNVQISEASERIDVSALRPGIYLIRIATQDEVFIQKFRKE
ncbi:MAG: M4 family metallopeptidase [Bacteroidota bacterium]